MQRTRHRNHRCHRTVVCTRGIASAESLAPLRDSSDPVSESHYQWTVAPNIALVFCHHIIWLERDSEAQAEALPDTGRAQLWPVIWVHSHTWLMCASSLSNLRPQCPPLTCDDRNPTFMPDICPERRSLIARLNANPCGIAESSTKQCPDHLFRHPWVRTISVIEKTRTKNRNKEIQSFWKSNN